LYDAVRCTRYIGVVVSDGRGSVEAYGRVGVGHVHFGGVLSRCGHLKEDVVEDTRRRVARQEYKGEDELLQSVEKECEE